MKKREPEQIGDIIKRAIEQSGNQTIYNEQRLCYMWPDVVGPTINRYTTRRWVEHGTMHVVITSAPLKNELSFHKTALIEQLNKAAGVNVINNLVIH
jgi:hypothetical protein